MIDTHDGFREGDRVRVRNDAWEAPVELRGREGVVEDIMRGRETEEVTVQHVTSHEGWYFVLFDESTRADLVDGRWLERVNG